MEFWFIILGQPLSELKTKKGEFRINLGTSLMLVHDWSVSAPWGALGVTSMRHGSSMSEALTEEERLFVV